MGAPVGSAEWVVGMFFRAQAFPERRQFSTGEFALRWKDLPTVGEMFKPAQVVQRQIQTRPDGADFAVRLTTENHTQDWYAFLVKTDNSWKLSAVRTLRFPSGFYRALDSLHRIDHLPDSVAADVRRMDLTIASDAVLTKHLRERQQDFAAIVDLFDNSGVQRIDDRGRTRGAGSYSDGDSARLVGLMRQLLVGAILKRDDRPGCTFVKIGGVGHSEVGYMRAPEGCQVPTMSPDEFVLMDMLSPGWYLYKTD